MQVGFIGLGSVGGKLAGSLLRNGVALRVHDLDAGLVAAFVGRGAQAGGSPAAIWPGASAAGRGTLLP